MELREAWAIYIDRGRGSEECLSEGEDLDKICLRIGQMVLSTGIEQIIVYRNGKEYRRYKLLNRIPDIPIQMDPTLPDNTIKIGDVTITGIKEE